MSKVIHNPALAKIIDNSENSSTFVIEPLHFNYGNTLGNSLRRVLLSSIRGLSLSESKVPRTNSQLFLAFKRTS